MVAVIGIERPGDGQTHDLQRHTPCFGLEGLEVLETTNADQALDLGGRFAADVRRDRRDDFFFLASLIVSRCTSHNRVLTSIRSRVRSRARRYSAIWARVSSTASGGTTTVRVLPSCDQVNDQLGP